MGDDGPDLSRPVLNIAGEPIACERYYGPGQHEGNRLVIGDPYKSSILEVYTLGPATAESIERRKGWLHGRDQKRCVHSWNWSDEFRDGWKLAWEQKREAKKQTLTA
jgi:hypothetical protein